MKTLIAEDDFTSRLILQRILDKYGPSHVAVNGKEAVEAIRIALETDEPYDLVCLDIMMPEMSGQDALKEIRALEHARGITAAHGARIVMTTAISDGDTVRAAIRSNCNYFLTKPIHKAKLLATLREMALID